MLKKKAEPSNSKQERHPFKTSGLINCQLIMLSANIKDLSPVGKSHCPTLSRNSHISMNLHAVIFPAIFTYAARDIPDYRIIKKKTVARRVATITGLLYALFNAPEHCMTNNAISLHFNITPLMLILRLDSELPCNMTPMKFTFSILQNSCQATLVLNILST
jgi:hypothetical protein